MNSINLAPSGTEMKGMMVWIAANSAAADSACSSRLRRVLNRSSGRSRNVPAISIKAESVGSADPVCLAPASIPSMAWSSCSMSARSGMGALHLSPKTLNCTELKLLHRALAPPEFLGNLPDAFLLHEAHVNHSELRFRKPVHQLEQHGAAFDFGGNGGFWVPPPIARLPARALSVVGPDARGGPPPPPRKKHPPPPELFKPPQSFAEDIGRQILGLVPVADAPDDVSVHAIKVPLVQVGKAGGVALGGLDLRPFVMLLAHGQ